MDIGNFIKIIEQYKDLITIILTMVGWFVVVGFGFRQQKKLLRNTAKMKIYDELYLLKKELDERSQKL